MDNENDQGMSDKEFRARLGLLPLPHANAIAREPCSMVLRGRETEREKEVSREQLRATLGLLAIPEAVKTPPPEKKPPIASFNDKTPRKIYPKKAPRTSDGQIFYKDAITKTVLAYKEMPVKAVGAIVNTYLDRYLSAYKENAECGEDTSKAAVHEKALAATIAIFEQITDPVVIKDPVTIRTVVDTYNEQNTLLNHTAAAKHR